MARIHLWDVIVAWIHSAFAIALHTAFAFGVGFYYVVSFFTSFVTPARPAPKSILITGAASGIGQGLALKYAAPGVTLALTDRNEAGLQQTASECRAKGAQVSVAIVDVTDVAAMTAWVSRADSDAPIDLAYACAGIGDHQDRDAGRRPVVERIARITRDVFRVNVDGVHNTLLPLVEPMVARGVGQLVVLASLAGFGSLLGPEGLAYCASKAAVKVWGEGLRAVLAPHGVGVTVVCPGFIETPMTHIIRDKLALRMVTLAAAVKTIADGVARDLPVVAFPAPIFIVASLTGGAHWLLGELRGRLLQATLGAGAGGQQAPLPPLPAAEAAGSQGAASPAVGRTRRPSLKSL